MTRRLQGATAINAPGSLRIHATMHRRTLDRHLDRFGTSYGELLESVHYEVARQLLTDTRMPVQRIAAALHFSSAANFSTAFRRWSGTTPSAFRARAH